MRIGGMYRPEDAEKLMTQAPDQVLDTLQRAGASAGANGREPLVRSSHLINIKTGMIFPWDPILAEQTDILRNCDAMGNTDPAAWGPTVNPVAYTEEERDTNYWRARDSMFRHDVDAAVVPYQQSPEGNTPVVTEIPQDVVTLDQYYTQRQAEVNQLAAEISAL